MKDLGNKVIASLHVFIILYGLYSTFLLWDDHNTRFTELEQQFPGVQQELESNKVKVKEIQEFVKRTEESKVRVEEVAKNIEAAQKQLPADINDNQILTFFTEEINTLNIKDPSIIPGTETPNTYFISKDYAVKAKGTFLQFLVFFERIGNATRIYNIKNLKLVSTSDSNRGRFQMITADAVIEAFRYNPEFKVDRGFDKIIQPGAGTP
jgi:Tfp pilus assembly protein PilO